MTLESFSENMPSQYPIDLALMSLFGDNTHITHWVIRGDILEIEMYCNLQDTIVCTKLTLLADICITMTYNNNPELVSIQGLTCKTYMPTDNIPIEFVLYDTKENLDYIAETIQLMCL